LHIKPKVKGPRGNNLHDVIAADGKEVNIEKKFNQNDNLFIILKIK